MPDASLLETADLSIMVDGDKVPSGDEDIDQATLPEGTVTATTEETV